MCVWISTLINLVPSGQLEALSFSLHVTIVPLRCGDGGWGRSWWFLRVVAGWGFCGARPARSQQQSSSVSVAVFVRALMALPRCLMVVMAMLPWLVGYFCFSMFWKL